jgi:hypothetical protein
VQDFHDTSIGRYVPFGRDGAYLLDTATGTIWERGYHDNRGQRQFPAHWRKMVLPVPTKEEDESPTHRL